jgi:hypothetical protein
VLSCRVGSVAAGVEDAVRQPKRRQTRGSREGRAGLAEPATITVVPVSGSILAISLSRDFLLLSIARVRRWVRPALVRLGKREVTDIMNTPKKLGGVRREPRHSVPAVPQERSMEGAT